MDSRPALALAGVEAAHESADGIANEEENLLAGGDVAQAEAMGMQKNHIPPRHRLSLQRGFNRRPAGLSDVEKMNEPLAQETVDFQAKGVRMGHGSILLHAGPPDRLAQFPNENWFFWAWSQPSAKSIPAKGNNRSPGPKDPGTGFR